MYFVLENFNIFNSTIFENSFFAIYPSSSRFFSVLILVVEVVQKLYYCGLISSSETLSNFPKAIFQFQIYSAMSRPQTERFDRFTLVWFVSLFPTFQFWNMNASSLRTRPKSQQIKTTTDVSLFLPTCCFLTSDPCLFLLLFWIKSKHRIQVNLKKI